MNPLISMSIAEPRIRDETRVERRRRHRCCIPNEIENTVRMIFKKNCKNEMSIEYTSNECGVNEPISKVNQVVLEQLS